MKVRVVLVGVAAFTACLAFATTSATAKPLGKGLTLVTFTAPASDGYKVTFTASAGPVKDEQASFSFNRGTQSVTYSVDARTAIDGNHIEGDFGKFGSFSGVFTGKITDGKGCKPFVNRKSEFTGTLDVRGEHGFASARLHGAKGRFVALIKDPDCNAPTRQSKLGVKADQVLLKACPTRNTELYAHLDRRHGRTAFQVNTLEHRGKVLIARTAYANGEAGSFDVADDLSEATLKPGGPFTGSASFANGRLTGDLVVEELGLTDPVAVTPAKAAIASGRDHPRC